MIRFVIVSGSLCFGALQTCYLQCKTTSGKSVTSRVVKPKTKTETRT